MRESSWIGKGSSRSRLSDPRPQRRSRTRIAFPTVRSPAASLGWFASLPSITSAVDPPPSKLRPWYTPIDTRKSPSSDERHAVARLLSSIDRHEIDRGAIARESDRRPRVALRGETRERALDGVGRGADVPAILHDARPPTDDHR